MTDSVFTVLGRWAWGPCEAADVRGNYAYIGNGTTFHVLDISNPSSPTIVGEYLTNGYVTDIRLRDTLAFVTTGGGLLILNIASPNAPTRVGEVYIGGGTIRVAPVDSFAYVTNITGILRVVDVSNPASPFVRGGVNVLGEFAYCLAAKGKYAFAGNQEEPDFLLIDATDPDNPQRMILNIPYWVWSATVRDSLLYVGTTGSFYVYNISTPSAPVFMGGCGLSPYAYTIGITIEGTMAYVSTYAAGVFAVDISTPTQPQLRGHFNTIGSGRPGIAAVGQNVYAAFYTGLLVVNTSQPDSLRQTSYFPTGGFSGKMDIQRNVVYVASGVAGLWLLDISDPTHPKEIANVQTGGFTSDVVVSGNSAYIVNWAGGGLAEARGLWIIDISDSSHPQVMSHHIGIARYSSTIVPNSIAKEGDLVFMTQVQDVGLDSVMEIIDVSDPSQPGRLSVFSSIYYSYDVAAKDSSVFLATFQGGVRVIDIHDVFSPVEISSLLNSAFAVGSRDSFLVALIDSCYVINAKDPRFPFVMGSTATHYGNSSMAGAIYGSYVYWAEGELGAVDISNPNSPIQTGTFSGSDWGRGVAAKNNIVLFGDQRAGVWVLQNNLVTSVQEHVTTMSPQVIQLYQNFPNPFNPRTTFELYMPKRGRAALEVYDLLGRKVITLLDKNVESGSHRISFDASWLSSGVYFYTLRTENNSITRKMLIIR